MPIPGITPLDDPLLPTFSKGDDATPTTPSEAAPPRPPFTRLVTRTLDAKNCEINLAESHRDSVSSDQPFYT